LKLRVEDLENNRRELEWWSRSGKTDSSRDGEDDI